MGPKRLRFASAGTGLRPKATVTCKWNETARKIEVRTSSTLVLDPQLDPLSYSWSQKGTQSSQLSIDFRTQPAPYATKQVNGQDDRRDFKLDKDVVVLDDNVVHHYQLAVARYDQAKGGTQAFRAFIPQDALPGVITLNSVGPEAVTVDGDKRTLRHFLLPRNWLKSAFGLTIRAICKWCRHPTPSFRRCERSSNSRKDLCHDRPVRVRSWPG